MLSCLYLPVGESGHRLNRRTLYKTVSALRVGQERKDYHDEKCITDGCPQNGFYLFREVGKGDWIISSDMRAVRILTEEEVEAICLEKGHDRAQAFEPYRQAMAKSAQTRLAKNKAKSAKKSSK